MSDPAPSRERPKSLARPIGAVEERKRGWLLPGFLPDDEFVEFPAPPKAGKSTFAWWCVAQVTQGHWGPNRFCFIASQEEEGADIKAGLRAAGANLRYVRWLPDDGERREIRKASELDWLDDVVTEKKYALVVIDSVESFAVEVQVNAILNRLRKMARRFECSSCCCITSSSGPIPTGWPSAARQPF